MKFQVEEDLVSATFDFFYNLVAGTIIKLHAYFQERLTALAIEFIKKCECFLCVGEIAGYDYVSVHVLCCLILFFNCHADDFSEA